MDTGTFEPFELEEITLSLGMLAFEAKVIL